MSVVGNVEAPAQFPRYAWVHVPPKCIGLLCFLLQSLGYLKTLTCTLLSGTLITPAPEGEIIAINQSCTQTTASSTSARQIVPTERISITNVIAATANVTAAYVPLATKLGVTTIS
eukprot:COSAG06_NODE_33332_length_491_cov_1.147959_1_plen_115_part_10